MASTDDTHMQALSVSAMGILQENLSRKTAAVLSVDLALIAHWGSAPSPNVSQRIPLALGMLLLSPVNRERVAAPGNQSGVLKAIVAAARAANKYKQMHAALAMCIAARGVGAASVLIQLGESPSTSLGFRVLGFRV
jgi:hypothetical protein